MCVILCLLHNHLKHILERESLASGLMGHRNEVTFLQLLLTAFEGGPHSGVQAAFALAALLPQALRGGIRGMCHHP